MNTTSCLWKIFVTGGCRGSCCRAIQLHVAQPSHDATDEAWCFCPVTLTCTPTPAMLKARTMHAAVTCLDKVYVIGGRTRGSTGETPSLVEVKTSLFNTEYENDFLRLYVFNVYFPGGILQPSDQDLVLSQPPPHCHLLPRGDFLWQPHLHSGI